MARNNPTAPLRRAGTFAVMAGSLFSAAGIGAWCTITKQLQDEKITVPGNAPAFAGKPVQDPASAYVQALVIKRNAEHAAGGRTFADISSALRGLDASSEEAKELHTHSASLSTAASLRTSLMTSVLAYGVSAFAAGLGGLLILMGTQLRRHRRR